MSQAAIAALADLSGTAFWIARYRALETARRSPLFRDPWAAQLAGERGRAIVEQLPAAKRYTWVFVMRTLILDNMITEQLKTGRFDTVINLASGLDTRAFRLDIPRDVRWFDVDTAQTTEYKRGVLRSVSPHCQWTGIAADLSDKAERQALLTDLSADARKVLVISEGLLLYLSEFQVDALARDLHAQPKVQAWVFDINSRESLTEAQRLWAKPLRSIHAHFQFAPYDGTEFFAASGWRQAEHTSIVGEALRLKRLPLGMRGMLRLAKWIAPSRYEGAFDSGIARLERQRTADVSMARPRPDADAGRPPAR